MAAPIITNQPDDTTVTQPYDVTFTIEADPATLGHTLSYQWYDTSGAISGETSSTYTISAPGSAYDGTTYYCIVTDVEDSDTVTSNTVTLTVLPFVSNTPTRIKLKRSHVAGTKPSTGNLAEGEVAINTADGKIYSRDDSDNIVELGGLQDGISLPTSDPSVAGALWSDSGVVKISNG